MIDIETERQKQSPDVGRDRLDMAYINSLPLPLWDEEWPVYDIDVETGLYRIDVCGLFEVRHIDRCFTMKDATGKSHYVGDFELDPEQWEERVRPEVSAPTPPAQEVAP
jgi:hypothetical protein